MKSLKRVTFTLAMMLACFALSHADAAVIFAGSPGAMNANGTYDWDTVGLGPLPSPTHLVSPGGVGFTISEPNDVLSISNLPSFFSSNGGTDDFVLGAIHSPQAGPIRIELDTPAYGIGAAMEWGGYEVAQYTITAFDSANNVLLTNTINSGNQGDPGFVGVFSDAGDIKAVTFTYNGPTGPHSIALGNVSFAAPEPATFLLAGLGLVAGLFARRRAR